MHPHRAVQLLLHVGDGGRGVGGVLRTRQLPEAPPLEDLPARRDTQEHARIEQFDALYERAWPGHESVPEEGLQAEWIEVAAHAGNGEQRAQLGCEQEAPTLVREIQRLDAEAISRDQDRGAARVPKHEREHAAQPLDARFSPLGIRREHDFRVGRGNEAMTELLELGAQFLEVVTLAVEDRDHAIAAVDHRLAASLAKIEDGQATMAKADARILRRLPHAALIRPAMQHGREHSLGIRERGGPGGPDHTGNAAHQVISWRTRCRRQRVWSTIRQASIAPRLASENICNDSPPSILMRGRLTRFMPRRIAPCTELNAMR